MRQYTITPKTKMIPLGHAGENQATQIIFDVAKILSDFGEDGTFVLLHKRPLDTTAYPVATVLDGDKLTWDVTSADTAQAVTTVRGWAELQYIQNECVVKSKLWRTVVSADIGETGEVPDPETGWVQAMLTSVQEIVDAGTSEEKVAEAVASYMEEHPVGIESIPDEEIVRTCD